MANTEVTSDKLEFSFRRDGYDHLDADGHFEISKNGIYRWLSGGVSGLGTPDAEIRSMGYAVLPGAHIQSARLKPRSMSIKFTHTNLAYAPIARDRINQFFEAGSSGNITVRRERGAWTTRYILEAVDIRQDNIFRDRITVTVHLFCPSPYFHAPIDPTDPDSVLTISAVDGSFDVPRGQNHERYISIEATAKGLGASGLITLALDDAIAQLDGFTTADSFYLVMYPGDLYLRVSLWPPPGILAPERIRPGSQAIIIPRQSTSGAPAPSTITVTAESMTDVTVRWAALSLGA